MRTENDYHKSMGAGARTVLAGIETFLDIDTKLWILQRRKQLLLAERKAAMQSCNTECSNFKKCRSNNADPVEWESQRAACLATKLRSLFALVDKDPKHVSFEGLSRYDIL